MKSLAVHVDEFSKGVLGNNQFHLEIYNDYKVNADYNIQWVDYLLRQNGVQRTDIIPIQTTYKQHTKRQTNHMKLDPYNMRHKLNTLITNYNKRYIPMDEDKEIHTKHNTHITTRT